jgi:hypothetical protein
MGAVTPKKIEKYITKIFIIRAGAIKPTNRR